MSKRDPINPTDDTAREMAADLCLTARFGALGVLDPDTGHPSVTRIAVLWHDGRALTLVSELSSHTQALYADPRCSLLIGEPGSKGNPLTYPRMTLSCEAHLADKSQLHDVWIAAHPKSKLYFGFGDFQIMALTPSSAALNGGFGKAYALQPGDLPRAG